LSDRVVDSALDTLERPSLCGRAGVHEDGVGTEHALGTGDGFERAEDEIGLLGVACTGASGALVACRT